MRPTALVLVLLAAATARAEPRRSTTIEIGGAQLTFSGGMKPESAHIAARRDGKQLWALDGLTAIAAGHAMPAFLAGPCDAYGFAASPQALGTRAAARLDMLCILGEDHRTVREYTILVDSLEPYHVLWAGEADVIENDHDVCVTESLVAFALDTTGKKLVATTTVTATKAADGSCAPNKPTGKPRVTVSKRVVAL